MDNNKLDPVSFVLLLLIKGVLLGVILFIALPVKNLLDKGARAVGNTAKEALRREKTVTVSKSLIKVPKQKGSSKSAQKVLEQAATQSCPF